MGPLDAVQGADNMDDQEAKSTAERRRLIDCSANACRQGVTDSPPVSLLMRLADRLQSVLARKHRTV